MLQILEALFVKVETGSVMPDVSDVDLHILVDQICSPLVSHMRRDIDEDLKWLLDLVQLLPFQELQRGRNPGVLHTMLSCFP